MAQRNIEVDEVGISQPEEARHDEWLQEGGFSPSPGSWNWDLREESEAEIAAKRAKRSVCRMKLLIHCNNLPYECVVCPQRAHECGIPPDFPDALISSATASVFRNLDIQRDLPTIATMSVSTALITQRCPKCWCVSWSAAACEKEIIVLSESGVASYKIAKSLRCTSCNFSWSTGNPETWFGTSFFPASFRDVRTVAATSVLSRCRRLMYTSKASRESLLKSFLEDSLGQCAVSSHTFRRALNAWMFLTSTVNSNLFQDTTQTCPICTTEVGCQWASAMPQEVVLFLCCRCSYFQPTGV